LTGRHQALHSDALSLYRFSAQLLPNTQLMTAVNVMNKAAHVVDVSEAEAQEAIQKGKAFLESLRNCSSSSFALNSG
jgi:hypothetical protein